ncbi:MAG: helix-turn-helix domain-containing protein [Halanaerobiales bacterium]
MDIPILKNSKVDDRVHRTVVMIEDSDYKKLALNELANNVALSESRLQHIFKKQIGISIKRYMLWKRIIDGIKIIAGGTNFTFAAHKAGFADSAHMSRTFKRMFGITLSDLFKNSSFVQVLIENS